MDDVKRRMDAGTLPDCLAGEAIRNQKKIGMDDLFLAYSISSPFGAGIETVRVSLLQVARFSTNECICLRLLGQ